MPSPSLDWSAPLEVGLDKVEVNAVTLLKDQKGQVYPPGTIDPEGIALSRHLSIPLENLEGMALGPRLQDGTKSLLLVSDNNFGAEATQFLLFRLKQG